MGKSKPEPEQGFGNVVKAMSSAGHNINAFARTVLAGKGTPGQIIFFAVGILGFAAIVLGITLASARAIRTCSFGCLSGWPLWLSF